jgi:hypothetical protein
VEKLKKEWKTHEIGPKQTKDFTHKAGAVIVAILVRFFTHKRGINHTGEEK